METGIFEGRIMRRLTVLLAVLLIAIAGCEKEEEEEPLVEEAPPPSPQEIAQKIIRELDLTAPIPPPEWNMPKEVIPGYLSAFRSARSQHSSTMEGKEALRIVSRAVDKRLNRMEEAEHWDAILLLCDVHEILNPGSTKFNLSREKAEVELRKPRVTVKGIMEAAGQKVAFLHYYLPLTGERFDERVRVGEEFYGLRLLNIIGMDRGVRLEYLETGESFEVLNRSQR